MDLRTLEEMELELCMKKQEKAFNMNSLTIFGPVVKLLNIQTKVLKIGAQQIYSFAQNM